MNGQAKPAGHGVHDAWLPVLYVPAAQGVADANDVLAQAWPGGQAGQVTCPPTEYVPGEHTTPAAVVQGQRKPGGHTSQVVLPAAEVEPAGHATGPVDCDGQRLPAGHCVHATAPPSA